MQQASGGSSNGLSAGPPNDQSDHPVRAFLRANPQVLVLLIICLVLGLGTFFAVVIGLIAAGSDQTTGEPSDVILGAHAVLQTVRVVVLP
jgi:hypothetical protein